jgi:hypothetical protein
MLKKVLFGLSAAVLAVVGLVAATSGHSRAQQEPKVICCGECKPGDNCLEKCQVVGNVPMGTKLACCGKCEKGDDCLTKCGSKRSCCEAGK